MRIFKFRNRFPYPSRGPTASVYKARMGLDCERDWPLRMPASLSHPSSFRRLQGVVGGLGDAGAGNVLGRLRLELKQANSGGGHVFLGFF